MIDWQTSEMECDSTDPLFVAARKLEKALSNSARESDEFELLEFPETSVVSSLKIDEFQSHLHNGEAYKGLDKSIRYTIEWQRTISRQNFFGTLTPNKVRGAWLDSPALVPFVKEIASEGHIIAIPAGLCELLTAVSCAFENLFGSNHVNTNFQLQFAIKWKNIRKEAAFDQIEKQLLAAAHGDDNEEFHPDFDRRMNLDVLVNAMDFALTHELCHVAYRHTPPRVFVRFEEFFADRDAFILSLYSSLSIWKFKIGMFERDFDNAKECLAPEEFAYLDDMLKYERGGVTGKQLLLMRVFMDKVAAVKLFMAAVQIVARTHPENRVSENEKWYARPWSRVRFLQLEIWRASKGHGFSFRSRVNLLTHCDEYFKLVNRFFDERGASLQAKIANLVKSEW